ncbi:MAG: hypothetical protein ACI82F_001240 [Planctomycetota bacterium]|jgi:hypothetical protein
MEQRLGARIELEATSLGISVPWAGTWRSAGLFMGEGLALAPRAGWMSSYYGCMGSDTNGRGRVEVLVGVIHLVGGDGDIEGRYFCARYGGEPRLLDADNAGAICSRILEEERGGQIHTDYLGFSRLGSRRPLAGFTWELPLYWRMRLDGSPSSAAVLASGAPFSAEGLHIRREISQQAVLIDVGQQDGAWEGLRFHRSGCSESSCIGLRLVRVGERVSEAILEENLVDPWVPLERGEILDVVRGKAGE